MIKNYRVRFFRLAYYEEGERFDSNVAGRSIVRLLTSANPMPQFNLALDYHYQVRETARSGGFLHGCFAKLRSDAPHIVLGNTNQEQQIPLAPGDKVVDKSYFVFFPSVSLLAIQVNRDGGTITRLIDYLNQLLPPGQVILREDIIRPDAMEQLEEHEVKWLEVSFVRPRNIANARPNDWTSQTIGNLGGVNAGHVKVRIGAPRSDTLGGRTADFIQDLFRQGAPTAMRVKLEDVDSPIDLLAEVVQGDIQVRLQNGYPDPAIVLREILRVYREQRGRLQVVFGDAEPLP